ncbi:MAG: DNA topoisomerase IV subunit A [Ornithinimicrobium sp.]
MARRSRSTPEDLGDFTEKIIDIDVEDEMQGAFLEYAYSVIYSRALPDARDGLKPVQRRILFGMSELGLRPDRAHVKCSRVVGEVMGKYHPHGDLAIYEAMVRMAQSFTMRLPLVDGHGNFGSLDDGPAASRYTEARMSLAALLMTRSLDEETVDFVPNYDDQLMQPDVLPAAYPNLLVNGAAGIAVGMATNMAPHNLVEVIGAARHLIAHPRATLDDLMRFVPGPDLPSGGTIVGLDGIREAYESGRGSFKTRASARIENLTPRRKGIVVTELPYLVGPEKVIEKVKQLVLSKKLQGISNINDLTDRTTGMQLVIEVKNGFNPEAVLERLFAMTPMQDSFGINNVALVDGRPGTLGLRDLLQVYVDFRVDVVRRRTTYRLGRKEDRLHLVLGLLIAIADIDEVIQVIRSSDDVAAAKERLISIFDLSDVQATYILDLQLRRLTKFSRIELETEREDLERDIATLRALLEDETLLLQTVSDELAAVAREHGTPRRTVLLESSGASVSGAAASTSAKTPMEVPDDPCRVLLSNTGLLARTSSDEALGSGGARSKHDVLISQVLATGRGTVGLVTSTGRVHTLSVLELPSLPPTNGSPSLSGGTPLAAFVDLAVGEQPLALCSLSGPPAEHGLALATRQGIVKRVNPDYPSNREVFEVINLKDGDAVIGAVELRTGFEQLVFFSSDGNLLTYAAALVRPQGRAGGGMAGMKLSAPASVIGFAAVDVAVDVDGDGDGDVDGGATGGRRAGVDVTEERDAVVVTVAGASGALPGTETGSVKVTDLSEYPTKGRGTAGVRCHRFVRGEDALILGWAGPSPARAASANGVPVDLPEASGKRDGSGTPAAAPIAAVAGDQRRLDGLV